MSEAALAEAMERMMKELQDLKGQMQQIRASQVLPAMAQSSGAAVPMSEDEDLEEERTPVGVISCASDGGRPLGTKPPSS